MSDEEDQEVIELEPDRNGIFREVRRVREPKTPPREPKKRKDPYVRSRHPQSFYLMEQFLPQEFVRGVEDSRDRDFNRFLDGVDTGLGILERLNKLVRR